MRVFLSKESRRLLRRGLLGICLSGGLVGGVLAQQSEPIQLLPLPAQDGTSPQTLTLPGATPQQQIPAPDATPLKQDIQIDRLTVPSSDAVGLISPQASGLGADPWSGTDLDFALTWIGRVSGDLLSPTLRGLVLRLLTAAAPPPARSLTAPAPQAGQSLANLVDASGDSSRLSEARVAALMRLGAVTEARDLAAALPRAVQSSTLLRLQVEAWLVLGQLEPACRTVRQAVLVHRDDPFWPRALILCQLAAGEIDQALLGLDLLQELDPEGGALFLALALHMAGGDATALPPGTITALEFAMMRALLYPLPEDLSERLPVALLAAVATAQNATPEQRAWAAEQALLRGLVGPEVLHQAYAGLAFEPEVLDQALSRGPEIGGLRGRALLFQAHQARSLDIARAEILRAALAMARDDGHLALALRALADAIAALPPGSELSWFAGDAAAVFFAQGELEHALAWDRLLQLSASDQADSAAGRLRVWPYARLRGFQPSGDTLGIATWAAARADRDEFEDLAAPASDESTAAESLATEGLAAGEDGESEGDSSRRIDALLVTAFDHLALPDTLAWHRMTRDSLLMQHDGPPLALGLAARRALREERLAAFVLLAAAGLAEEGSVPHSLAAFDLLLEGLTHFGLVAEARALAIEALILRGL